MSRVGKKIISLPKNVKLTINGSNVNVEGPLGKIALVLPEALSCSVENNEVSIVITSSSPVRQDYAQQGLFRSLVANMIIGVSQGFQKKLELQGVGYRAAVQGKILDLSLGFSHPVQLEIPEAVKVAIEKNTLITLSSFDKHLLGQFAANIRAKRPPEPYQGKGVRYQGEYVRRKAGKTTKGKK